MAAFVLRLACLLVLPALLAVPPAAAQAPSAVGLWLVEKKDGAIEVYPCGAQLLCGRLAWMNEPLQPDGTPKRDFRNDNEAQRNRPLCGLEMMTGFRQDSATEWKGGKIYSPEDGSTYSAQMRLESADRLSLHGYIGIPLLGRSVTWTRLPPDAPRCKLP